MTTSMSHCLRGALVVCLLLGWTSAQGANVPTPAELMEKYGLSPGMKITKENAHLIKDLVPEAFHKRVVAGDYELTMGKLDPPDALTKVYTQEFYQRSEENAGKYELDEYGGIIEKATGQRPWRMPMGLPFPDLDFKDDPKKLGTKIQWNSYAVTGLSNDTDGGEGTRVRSFSYKGPANRDARISVVRQPGDFRSDLIPELKRPVSYQSINRFLAPSDAFGAATLTWRWTDPARYDSVWNYSPAVRRVRKQTSANRSDPTLGTELVLDDGNNFYAGKTEQFEWKYVGQQAMLMPAVRPQDQSLEDLVIKWPFEGQPVEGFSGPYAFKSVSKRLTPAYEAGAKQYASWWPIDILWIPVWAYVVEAHPKDPYYNFGRQIFYFEVNSYACSWKLAYNRAGEYWRTGFSISDFVRFDAPDKQRATMDNIGYVIVDEIANRGAIMLDGGVNYNIGISPEVMSMSKFMVYGK